MAGDESASSCSSVAQVLPSYGRAEIGSCKRQMAASLEGIAVRAELRLSYSAVNAPRS